MAVERERYIRPLVDTAETVDEIDECCQHLRDCLTYADGEFRDMVREDLDALLERRSHLEPHDLTELLKSRAELSKA